MAENIPDGITAEDVENAIQDFKRGAPHGFGRSTFYDLIYEGDRFPPKAVLGLAARRLNGGAPLTPYDFTGGEKSKCFRILRGLGYEIGPKPDQPSPGHTTPTANQEDWTDDELRAAVVAYVEMHGMERNGQQVNKAEFNRKLRAGPLSGRTKGSVEFRMQNISHVLHARGLSWIEGYKPAPHTGEIIRQRIEIILGIIGYMDAQDLEATADPDDLENRSSRLLAAGLSEKPKGEEKPKAATTSTTSYVRDPKVKAWVLQEASGVCECCGETAPFTTDSGRRYLEVHHVVPLADDGPDTVENAVAVCPNCHRGLHLSHNRIDMVSRLVRRVERINL